MSKKYIYLISILTFVILNFNSCTHKESSKQNTNNKFNSNESLIEVYGEILTDLKCQPSPENLLLIITDSVTLKEIIRLDINNQYLYQTAIPKSDHILNFKLMNKKTKKTISTSIKKIESDSIKVDMVGC